MFFILPLLLKILLNLCLILSGKQETAGHILTEIKKKSSHLKIFFSTTSVSFILRYIKFEKILSFVLN